MAKKTKKVVPTKEDIQRKQMIMEYNRNNTTTQILERKVREEDIKELEDKLKDIQTNRSSMTYLIADKANAARVHDFLRNWNSHKFIWPKDMWRGVLKFDEYLDEWKAKYEAEACDLVFDFAALSYSYNMLMNPSGIGIEDAKYMQSVSDEYDAILNVMGEYIDDFQAENERFKLLQECLSARYQGFMMVEATSDAPVLEANEDNATKTDEGSDVLD